MLTVAIAIVGGLVIAHLVRFARRAHTIDRALTLVPASSRLPAWLATPLADALDAAGVQWLPITALQSWALSVLVAGALGSVLSVGFGCFSAFGAAVAGPVGLRLARGRRRRLVAGAVPDLLERAALELRSGSTVASALDALASGGGPLAADLARVRDRCALGASVTDAVGRWADERDAPGVRAAAGALALASSVGGACADALEGLAASLRSRLAVVAEAHAMSAQARLSAIVVGASPIAYLAWSAVVDPGPLRALIGTAAGRGCLGAALGFEALAVLWVRHILREEAAWS
ncbi:MAG: Flp pilus assembly protein TadB [Actinomycetia bacterium]|nr:Flp pilus assembly protein TadB [Actinomycetes bacterium]